MSDTFPSIRGFGYCHVKPPVVSFLPVNYEADDVGTVTLTLMRTGQGAPACTVDWVTVDGTAEASTDYAADSGTVSWDQGDITDKTIEVTVLTDNTDKIFYVVLNTPQGCLIGNGTATVSMPLLPSTCYTQLVVDNDYSSNFSDDADEVDGSGYWTQVTVDFTGGYCGINADYEAGSPPQLQQGFIGFTLTNYDVDALDARDVIVQINAGPATFTNTYAVIDNDGQRTMVTIGPVSAPQTYHFRFATAGDGSRPTWSQIT